MRANKKGVSTVIATVLIVALTLAVIGLIWSIITNFVKTQTEDAKSCSDIYNKVSFEREYTCYDSNEGTLQFSINIGDIELNEAIVSVSTATVGKSFTITAEGSTISGLTMEGDGSTMIKLPDKESGETYIFNMAGAGLTDEPVSLQIIPVVGETRCEVTDVIREFGAC